MRMQAPGLGSAFGRKKRDVSPTPPRPTPAARAVNTAVAQAQAINRQRAALQSKQNLAPSKEVYSSPDKGASAQFSPIEQAAAEARMHQAIQQGIVPGFGPGDGDASQVEYANMSPTAKARAAFMTFMREKFPTEYSKALQAATAAPGIGSQQSAGGALSNFDWSKFIDAAAATTTAIFQTKAQRDLLKVNIERARAGLPPIDTSFAAPQIRTQIDISPEIAARLEQQAGGIMGNFAVVAGVGLFALYMIMRR